MRNAHPRYTCFPSVVCVGKETEVTIFPRDISRIFREDREYQLAVVGLKEDQLDYYRPTPLDYPCKVSNGCLKFTYHFDQEQEYSIRFKENDGPTIRVSLYAVEEDLYKLRPLKGDLHAHTYYSDGQDGIAMTPADYREEGFDFYALTDHNRMFPSVLAAQLYEGIPLGMHMMTGEEIHTPGSLLHIVHVGGENSVCEQYIHHPEEYEASIDQIEKTLQHVPEQYRRRTALARWACDRIHSAGGLAIFAHPYWRPNRYNITDEFSNILFQEKIFDAFELMGGMNYKENNIQLALWQEQCRKGNCIPIVGTSDAHDHDIERSNFGRRFTVVFARENTTEAIMEAIRGGYSVAGELSSATGDVVHFYGTELRLVAFAHFLYDNYFNETWRLCVGEGILMRRYAEGEEVGEQLAGLADTVENFYRKFYGITAAPVMTESRRKFLEECLKQQRERGPLTRGSSLEIYGNNERRE